MIAKLCTYIATLGPIGHSQASGTVAAIVTMPVMFLLRLIFADDMAYGIVIVVLVVISFFIIRYVLKTKVKSNDDPNEVVLDEFLGCLITFWAIPLSSQSMIIGLIVYRFVDLLKVAHLHDTEKQSSVWAIMLDDIVAAALANIILQFLF